MKKVFASILGVCALFGASVLLQPAESAKDKSVKRIVYGIPQSPYVRKLMVVMHEKDLDFKLESTLPVSALKQKKQPIPIALSEASPLGKIPAYREDGGFTLADSSVIIDHLEHSGQGPSLYPEDNQQYAKARWFQQYADTVLGAIVDENILRERVLKPRVFGQQPNEEKVKNGIETLLPPVFDYLEKSLGDNEWITGETFSVADIAIATHFISLEIANVKLDASQWPKLAKYIERALARPSFQKVYQPASAAVS